MGKKDNLSNLYKPVLGRLPAEETMLKTISSSELRAQIKRVLNEVGYGRVQYIVERFGEPTAAIIGMEDFRLLQEIRRQQATTSFQEVIADIRARGRGLDPDDLDALIEEARTEFYHLQGRQADVH
ncbi:MAG: type II toxin-antitoxin system Phd/YefM family antitoxin [Chloroflexi bacterium]|nr:MAG: type II toxin-antitoxin system Phd/YefM family antitoxin [Chloroflexota bacterium]